MIPERPNGTSNLATRRGVGARKRLHSTIAKASCIIICGLLLAQPTPGRGQEPTANKKLVVGTKHSPPFAFKNSDGQWTGISIELWRVLADDLNLDYEFRELTLDQMLDGLESGELDAGVAAISVTAERHNRVDFCHPHFTTGLGIAVSVERQAGFRTLFARVVSARVLLIVGITIGIVVVCGLLFWRLERKRNQSIFGGESRQGIGMGVWWSTILLLGHKGIVPVSVWGRVVAVTAMLASIFLLSLLTGVIASILTVRQLDVGIEAPGDLRNTRVVTVESSTSESYLRQRRIACRARPTVEETLRAVAHGEADAAVYDAALLKYLANSDFAETIHVLPVTFNTQEYAIALQPESGLRKPLNESLLRFRASDKWSELIYRYLGE